MKCPKCGYTDTLCIQTADSTENRIRRRKQCLKCKYKFTTYEVYEGNINESSFNPGKRGPKPKMIKPQESEKV